jgi:hypothetical protein
MDLLVRVITRGQFPELWRQPDIRPPDFYRSYLATYLERDVRQLINVTSLRDFERFMRLLAVRSGQILNRTELSRETGITVNTVNEWLSALEASNQVALLEPWFHNFSKRIVKSPKIHFCDTGLLCFLLGMDSKHLLSSPFLGNIWETFVFSEIRKNNQTLAHPYQVFFYRDQRAREIDFVLERGGRLSFLECKWTEKPKTNQTQTIQRISRELETSKSPFLPGKHALVCRTPTHYTLENQIDVLPLSELTAWMQSEQQT